MSEVTMPRLTDTMQEGTIAHWLKKAGDEVKKGDILAEVETDKATMDLEAYEAGTLQQILVQEGETVPTGQAVALIGTGAVAQQPEQPAPAPAADRAGVEEAPASAPVQAESTTGSQEAVEKRGNDALVKASPLARRMAEEHNIDLSQVRGTGPGGRIQRDDIEDVLEQQHAAPTPTPPAPASQPAAPPQEVPGPAAQLAVPPPDVEISKLSRVQMLIARRLTEPKQTIPINRGIAVAVPSGLVVPVIQNTNIKGVRSIAREAKALIAKARANKLAPADLEGGTFSVSNLGMMDVSNFIAVINPPQAAILAVASTRKPFVPGDVQPG